MIRPGAPRLVQFVGINPFTSVYGLRIVSRIRMSEAWPVSRSGCRRWHRLLPFIPGARSWGQHGSAITRTIRPRCFATPVRRQGHPIVSPPFLSFHDHGFWAVR